MEKLFSHAQKLDALSMMESAYREAESAGEVLPPAPFIPATCSEAFADRHNLPQDKAEYKALAAAFNEFVKAGKIVKVGRGDYRWAIGPEEAILEAEEAAKKQSSTSSVVREWLQAKGYWEREDVSNTSQGAIVALKDLIDQGVV